MIKTQFGRAAVVVAALAMPFAAWADLTSSQTLNAGQSFSFDSGTVVSSGDITFSSSGIAFSGSARGLNIGAAPGAAGYGELTGPILQGYEALASTTPIPSSELVVGDIFALVTNGNNVAKAMVTASSSSSISFQFTTYGSTSGGGGTGGGSVPTITDIQNNSSLVPAGFPNSGVAPSTLFVIHGSGMASATTVSALQDSSQAGGLPTTLNGATVTVSAGGKTYTPGLYYAIATQIAGVLPAAVPAGTAMLTVKYNTGTSAAFSFTVVPSAYGIDTYDGNLAVAQDALNYSLVNYTNSAKPGQIVILWGSGLGADSADSDVSYTGTPHTIATQTQVYVGGVQATSVGYVGASVYPGVHIIQFTMPSGVPNGCYVPVAVITGGAVVSNVPTIPFMNSGGVCNDAYTGINGTTISTIGSGGTVSTGSVIVAQETSPGTTGQPKTNDIALANFQQTSGSSYAATGSTVSSGACLLSQSVTVSGTPGTVTGLNAGVVTVTPPGGSPITLQTIPQVAGLYETQLTAGAIPTSGGAFTFNGSGGTGANTVGPFSVTINFPNPILSWTNQSASATVTRSSGQTYTWTGGAAGSYVILTGSSSSSSASGSYTCIAPQSAGQFTVPQYVLLGLPAGTGTSGIENSSAFTSFTATGINYGYAIGAVETSVNTTWQ